MTLGRLKCKRCSSNEEREWQVSNEICRLKWLSSKRWLV